MSSEVLRRAASLMRERAEAAPTAPWTARETTHGDPANGPTHMVVENARGVISDHDYDRWGGTSAEHIASWHPTVALAAAKAMDDVAHAWEIADESMDGWVYDADDNHYRFDETVDGGWLNVALAYLGESA